MRVYRVSVMRRVPHPGRGFTQGLIAEPGDVVLESTGLYGESSLRRYRLGTSADQGTVKVPDRYFAEGICRVGDSLWQLTWRERKALRWDAATLKLRDVVSYNREGWGICAVSGAPVAQEGGIPEWAGQEGAGQEGAGQEGAGDCVVTSDGSSELVRRDAATLEPLAVIRVRCEGSRIHGLNDLTWSGGRVWANVAGTACLAGIDLATGEVTDLVNAGAAAERRWGDPQAIMNGLAALGNEEFLLTGKTWRWIRQVRLVPARSPGLRRRLEHLLAGAGR